jgi:hypothetical protein
MMHSLSRFKKSDRNFQELNNGSCLSGVCQVVLDDTCIHSDSDPSSVPGSYGSSDDRGSVSLRGGAMSPRRRTTHLRLTNRGIVQFLDGSLWLKMTFEEFS